MPEPTATALYAALATLVLLALAVRVSWLRRATATGIGDGGRPELQRAIRAHANAAENLPLALILLLGLELLGGEAWLLHATGSALVAGRVLHGWGLNRSSGETFGRAAGMLLTWAAMALLAVYALAAVAELPLPGS